MFNSHDWNHYVVFYTDDGVSICVYHMVGYEEFPTVHDIKHLVAELKTDNEHGMKELVKLCKIKVVDKQIAVDIMDENFLNWIR